MIGVDELVRRVAELNSVELARWIENRWVMPEHAAESEGERWVFHEVDVARVELILDIRREFAVDDEASAPHSRPSRRRAAQRGTGITG